MMLREPWRTRLLFASFALNLFFAGLIGTRAMHHPPERGPPGSEAFIRHMTRGMPDEDAARFREVMLQARRQNEIARSRMDAARRDLSHAIGQTPYDEATVQKAMRAWQAAWIDWSNALGASMLKALAELSPDGRRSLAEAGQRHEAP